MGRKFGFIVIALGLALSACGKGSPPTPTNSTSPAPSFAGGIPTNATIKILNPAPGQVVHGNSIVMHVQVQNAVIIPYATTKVDAHHGHVHIKLDGQLVTIIASATYQLKGLKPGRHLLYAEFVEGNHVPFNPRVINTVTFTDA